MTGKLEIRYRSPTPLFEPVTFEGWVVRVDGRKIFTEGTLKAGDRLCAEATGLFISFRTAADITKLDGSAPDAVAPGTSDR
jgi:acyl-coenzyme A thioesterase PaaI-like protein